MFRAGARKASLCLALAGFGAALLAPGLTLASTNVSALVCPNIFDAVTVISTETSPTTAKSLAVEGAAEPNSAVVLMVNGVQRATVTAALDGTYGATVPLVIGDNTIVATANDGACGDIASSAPLSMHRDQVAPDAPMIASPLNGAVTTESTVIVQGSAEADADLRLTVNGAEVAALTVPGDGLFSVSVPLVMGSNQIQAAATNPAGTGPLSAIVTVTRQLPPPSPTLNTKPSPVISPTVSPKPTTSSGVLPEVVRPTNGTTTTAESITVVMTGGAGARASVRVNGVEVANLRLSATGSGEVAVPLAVGENIITVVISGRSSASITVRRQAATQVPVITDPQDGSKLKSAQVSVAGRVEPGMKVKLLRGNDQIAEVTADETGSFEARVSMRPGINLLYAAVTAPDGTAVRSAAVRVDREESGAGLTGESGLAALLALPVAAALLTAQWLGEVLAEVASSPLAVVIVLSFSMAVSTLGRGLVGLEILLLVPGLIHSWWARRRGDVVRGRVVDSVTGRPLALAKVTIGMGQSMHVISGLTGGFAVPAEAMAGQAEINVDRPGYQPEEEPKPDLMVELEPVASSHSSLAVVMDIVSGLVAWPVMIFGAMLSWYIFVHSPGVFSLLLMLVATSVLVSNIGLLISQPRYQWGRLTDDEGEPLAGAEVSLMDSAGREVSAYRTNRSGRYTLYAEPGEYQLEVKVGDSVRHQEPLTVRRRGAYLGFGLKLPGANNNISGM